MARKLVWLLEDSKQPFKLVKTQQVNKKLYESAGMEISDDPDFQKEYILEAPLAEFGESGSDANNLNENDRWYSKDDYLSEVERVQDEIAEGSMFGSPDHPAEGYSTSMLKVSHLVTKLWLENDGRVWVQIKLIPTVVGGGMDLIAIHKAGGLLKGSARAIGFYDEETKEANIDTFFTVDVVSSSGFEFVKFKEVSNANSDQHVLEMSEKDQKLYENKKLNMKNNNKTKKLNESKPAGYYDNYDVKELWNEFSDNNKIVTLEDKINSIVNVTTGKGFWDVLDDLIDFGLVKKEDSEVSELLKSNESLNESEADMDKFSQDYDDSNEDSRIEMLTDYGVNNEKEYAKLKWAELPKEVKDMIEDGINADYKNFNESDEIKDIDLKIAECLDGMYAAQISNDEYTLDTLNNRLKALDAEKVKYGGKSLFESKIGIGKKTKKKLNESLGDFGKSFGAESDDKKALKMLVDKFGNKEFEGEDFSPFQNKENEAANDRLDKLIADGFISIDDETFICSFTDKGKTALNESETGAIAKIISDKAYLSTFANHVDSYKVDGDKTIFYKSDGDTLNAVMNTDEDLEDMKKLCDIKKNGGLNESDEAFEKEILNISEKTGVTPVMVDNVIGWCRDNELDSEPDDDDCKRISKAFSLDIEKIKEILKMYGDLGESSPITPDSLKVGSSYLIKKDEMEAYCEYKGEKDGKYSFDNSGEVIELDAEELPKFVSLDEKCNMNEVRVPNPNDMYTVALGLDTDGIMAGEYFTEIVGDKVGFWNEDKKVGEISLDTFRNWFKEDGTEPDGIIGIERIDEAKKKLNEAKDIELPNSNIILKGTGLDTNGNKIIKLSFPNQQGFSIQTNGTLPLCNKIDSNHYSESDLDLSAIEKELIAYIEEFGSNLQKSKLKKYKPLNEDDSTIDATSEVEVTHPTEGEMSVLFNETPEGGIEVVGVAPVDYTSESDIITADVLEGNETMEDYQDLAQEALTVENEEGNLSEASKKIKKRVKLSEAKMLRKKNLKRLNESFQNKEELEKAYSDINDELYFANYDESTDELTIGESELEAMVAEQFKNDYGKPYEDFAKELKGNDLSESVRKQRRLVRLDEKKKTMRKLNESNLLRQNKLSSEEYQKAKKLEGFKAENYSFNGDQNLYVKKGGKLNESDDHIPNSPVTDPIEKHAADNKMSYADAKLSMADREMNEDASQFKSFEEVQTAFHALISIVEGNNPEWGFEATMDAAMEMFQEKYGTSYDEAEMLFEDGEGATTSNTVGMGAQQTGAFPENAIYESDVVHPTDGEVSVIFSQDETTGEPVVVAVVSAEDSADVVMAEDLEKNGELETYQTLVDEDLNKDCEDKNNLSESSKKIFRKIRLFEAKKLRKKRLNESLQIPDIIKGFFKEYPQFKNEYAEDKSHNDYSADARLSYTDYTEHLLGNGEITQDQADTISLRGVGKLNEDFEGLKKQMSQRWDDATVQKAYTELIGANKVEGATTDDMRETLAWYLDDPSVSDEIKIPWFQKLYESNESYPKEFVENARKWYDEHYLTARAENYSDPNSEEAFLDNTLAEFVDQSFKDKYGMYPEDLFESKKLNESRNMKKLNEKFENLSRTVQKLSESNEKLTKDNDFLKKKMSSLTEAEVKVMDGVMCYFAMYNDKGEITYVDCTRDGHVLLDSLPESTQNLITEAVNADFAKNGGTVDTPADKIKMNESRQLKKFKDSKPYLTKLNEEQVAVVMDLSPEVIEELENTLGDDVNNSELPVDDLVDVASLVGADLQSIPFLS